MKKTERCWERHLRGLLTPEYALRAIQVQGSVKVGFVSTPSLTFSHHKNEPKLKFTLLQFMLFTPILRDRN